MTGSEPVEQVHSIPIVVVRKVWPGEYLSANLSRFSASDKPLLKPQRRALEFDALHAKAERPPSIGLGSLGGSPDSVRIGGPVPTGDSGRTWTILPEPRTGLLTR